MIAVEQGHEEVVRVILQQSKSDVHQAANDGVTTVFSLAKKNKDDKVLKLLLGKDGVQVNRATNQGFTPLFMAAEERHGNIVEMLLRKEEIRAIKWNGWRPHRRARVPRRLPVGTGGPRTAI